MAHEKRHNAQPRNEQALHISNMVCPRCIMAVSRLLAEEGFPEADVTLGRAVIPEPITPEAMERIRRRLEQIGFGLIDDPRDRLAERVRLAVMALARGGRMRNNLSEEIVRQIGHDYSSLSKLFSARQGCTIERYFIVQKIERAKELLSDSDMPLGEIAEMLGYSSTAHLSTQFKNTTGITPSDFRRSGAPGRKPIDTL